MKFIEENPPCAEEDQECWDSLKAFVDAADKDASENSGDAGTKGGDGTAGGVEGTHGDGTAGGVEGTHAARGDRSGDGKGKGPRGGFLSKMSTRSRISL